jgi:hypothetical protein
MKACRASLFPAAFLALLIAAVWPASQAVIENPQEPISKNPRRIVPLKETMRIKDEGRGYYFKLPWGLDVAPDGSIYVQDGLNLYKFAPDGRFVSNLIKAGQGPGELATELSNFLVDEEAVYLFGASSSKLLKIDAAGKLLKEWIIDKKRFLYLLAAHDRKLFFVDSRPKNPARTEGINESLLTMFLMSEDESLTPTENVFTIQLYLRLFSYGGRTGTSGFSVTRLRFSAKSRKLLYIADAPEYLIKQIDLEKASVVKVFRRAFPRIRAKKDSRDPRDMPDHENDVHRLLVHNENLWVLTSDYDPQKGVLIDVFDPEGRFIDSFVLPLTNIRTGDEFSQRYFPLVIRGDSLYAVEHDEDWSFSIAKYQIPDSIK